jgi:hypothetical protein
MKEDEMNEECSMHGIVEKFIQNFVRQPEWKRPLGRPRRRWEDNIRMNLRQTGWGGVDWIYLAQNRDKWRAVVNTVMKLKGTIKGGEFLHKLSDYWLLKKEFVCLFVS